MRFAYADPPYLGCCAYYGHHHEEPYGCWDDPETHESLLLRLDREYDGWAYSLSSPSLVELLPFAPPPCAGSSLGQTVRRLQAQRPVCLHLGAGPVQAGPGFVQGRCPSDP